MTPQALPIVSIPPEIHEEARALGMDAEELWRQRQELSDWVEVRTRCHELVDELPISALPEACEELGEFREHYEAIDRVRASPAPQHDRKRNARMKPSRVLATVGTPPTDAAVVCWPQSGMS